MFHFISFKFTLILYYHFLVRTRSSCYHFNSVSRTAQIMKLLILQFSPFSPSLASYGQHILFSTLFLNTFPTCSSPNIKDRVSHPHKTTAKITVSSSLFVCEIRHATSEQVKSSKMIQRQSLRHVFLQDGHLKSIDLAAIVANLSC